MAWASLPVSSIARGICRGFGLRLRTHSLETANVLGFWREVTVMINNEEQETRTADRLLEVNIKLLDQSSMYV